MERSSPHIPHKPLFQEAGRRLVFTFLVLLVPLRVGYAPAAEHALAHDKRQTAMSLKITSPAFDQMGEIPVRHTCDGDDVSPRLDWTGVPDGTKSLVLIVDDPDAPDPAAPRMTWVHWVLYNMPPDSPGLPEQVAPGALPPGTTEGVNDWKRTGYGGPCPPVGTHRYFHKLYALDVVLPDLGKAKKTQVEQSMKGHVLESAELVGTYKRRR